MKNPRSFLKHEILNIITLINFLIADGEPEVKQTKKILSYLKMLSVMVVEEDVFLGKKKAFLNQDVTVDDVIEIVSQLIREELKKAKCVLRIQNTHLIFKADFETIKSGIEQILKKLLSHATRIEISADQANKALIIQANSKIQLDVTDKNLLEALKEKKNHTDVLLILSLKLMRMNGLKIESKAGVVKISQA